MVIDCWPVLICSARVFKFQFYQIKWKFYQIQKHFVHLGLQYTIKPLGSMGISFEKRVPLFCYVVNLENLFFQILNIFWFYYDQYKGIIFKFEDHSHCAVLFIKMKLIWTCQDCQLSINFFRGQNSIFLQKPKISLHWISK